MGLMHRMRRLDDRVGVGRGWARGTLSRREYLAKLATRSVDVYVPREVYAELVDLHDKVATLEATVTRLELDRQ